jgi:tetratricopeptide (TPR) repeat protein
MIDKERAEALTQQAITAMNEEDWEAARSGFEQAAAADGTDWRLPNELGNCLLRLDSFDEAARAYERAFVIAPPEQRAFVLFNEALAYSFDDRVDDAIAAHQRVLQLDPGYAKSEAELGFLYRQKGAAKQALFHIDRAVSVLESGDLEDPSQRHHYALCLLNRARVHFFQLDDDEAGLEQAELLLEEARDLGKAWKLANELVEQGCWSAAKGVLELIIEEDPRGGPPRELLARVEYELS